MGFKFLVCFDFDMKKRQRCCRLAPPRPATPACVGVAGLRSVPRGHIECCPLIRGTVLDPVAPETDHRHDHKGPENSPPPSLVRPKVEAKGERNQTHHQDKKLPDVHVVHPFNWSYPDSTLIISPKGYSGKRAFSVYLLAADHNIQELRPTS